MAHPKKKRKVENEKTTDESGEIKMSGWTKEERQMIRDGMSWGDVWMLRNPEYILQSAEKMIEEAEQREKSSEQGKSKKSKKDGDNETK